MRYSGMLLWMLAALMALFIGFVDTHTDEVTVVALFLLIFGTALGFLQPRGAWRWWLLLGASVPAAQVLAHWLGWKVPYPNEYRDIAQSWIALVPAVIGVYCGVALRWGYAHHVAKPSRLAD